jgi:activating signal cointegrator complex subunit 1
MQVEATAITERTASGINALLDSMTDATQTEARDQGLRALVTSAIELARQLAVQKANLRVTMPVIMPHQQTFFDPSTMEDIGGEDEEDLTNREICCVTFPGMSKRGDEYGDQAEVRNVVAKARVLCSPE